MHWFRDMGLAVKLTLLLLLALSILLLSTVLLLASNTQTLTQEVGTERIGEEVAIVQGQLAQLERELQTDINALVTSVTFFQAVGSRDAAVVENTISGLSLSPELFDIVVVDGDGNRLIDTQVDTNLAAEDALLASALARNETVTLLAEDNEGETQVTIAVAAPVVSFTGNVLGAVQIGRQLTSEFLGALTFDREQVHVGLIYGDQIIARNRSGGAPIASNLLVAGVPYQAASVQQAQSGEAVFSDTLVWGEDTPYAVAYVPLGVIAESPAILMVSVELNDISSFQNTTLVNTISVFVANAFLTIAFIYFTLYRIAIRPINTVRTTAQEMIEGQYDQRIPLTSRDELGQLASTFNEMASAVQQRETSLQEAREEAERSDRVKSAFLASMSHELRTPLNSIINFTSFVLEGDTGPITDEQVDLLTEVVTGSRHLLNLINDVLDMSKIEAGSLRLFIEDNIDLDQLLARAMSTARSLLGDKPVVLTLESAPGLPRTRGDQQRILQILLNIMSNACKLTEEGEIKLKADHVDDEIIIAISDTGPGIPDEERDLIFQVFTQTKSGIKHGGGTGLGMPIAKSLTEAHGGRLWFDSEVGKGTTFYVALPVKSDTLVPTLEV